MPRKLKFTIPGDPVAKPRQTRSDKWKKRPCVMKYRAWADLARLCAKEQIGKLPDPKSILSLSLVAYFAPPATWSAKRRTAALGTLHRQRLDADNALKCASDALFEEDCAIAEMHVRKVWGEPARVEIEITVEDQE